MTLKLDVRQHQQLCVFTLSWGQGQWLSAEVPYPASVIRHYQSWQSAYLNFYRRLGSGPSEGRENEGTAASPPAAPASMGDLRGRVAESGTFSATEDWRSHLVQTEAQLLAEFHRWLNSAQLLEIRQQIAQIAQQQAIAEATSQSQDAHAVDVFLTCNSTELERLPWEIWELGREFAATARSRIVRTPKAIRSPARSQVPRRPRPRILVILGDDTGLNFHADRDAVRSLTRVAEVQFIGWQPGVDPQTLPTQITTALVDPRGWDVLFFAGHSNETQLTGGTLAIAPGLSISIREIAAQLAFARERGLQFALFNSCNGLSIAESLIDLGFSQVAVMREPIHNLVAQEFLVQFLRRLAEGNDVHEALRAACQFLKVEKNLTYPSTYLIPSLFRHPQAELFRLPQRGLKARVQPWLPTRRQAVLLTSLVALSLWLPAQAALLDQRLWVQSLYRRFTGQLATSPPPTLLVSIDDRSIREAKIADPHPMDRSYLAQLVARLANNGASVIGIDYLLDRPAVQPARDRQLAQAIRSGIAQQIWFVFATLPDGNGQWATLVPSLADPQWSLAGDMRLLSQGGLPLYVPLVEPEWFKAETQTMDTIQVSQQIPFTYWLAISRQIKEMAKNRSLDSSEFLSLSGSNSFAHRLLADGNINSSQYTPLIPSRAQLSSFTDFSYGLRQLWLHPIIDFSIPPAQIYDRLPAWQLLARPLTATQQQRLPQQVVMIVPGGYGEAGIAPGQDNMQLPIAVRHWRYWQRPQTASLTTITGGEVHAYLLHHYLTQRLVIPIPDLWMIGLAAVLGQSLVLRQFKPSKLRPWLAGGTVLYGLISLQLYLTAAIVLPWLLPTLTVWIYVLPSLRRPRHA